MSIPMTRLGRTGLPISRLGLGTMTFGLQTNEDVAQAILSKAASAGVTFIDTANVYPLGGTFETKGRTEEIVGRWLRGQRHNFILATKAASEFGPNPWDKGTSRKHLVDAIDGSLKRLQTDHVDLYQLHVDDRTTPLEETVEALDIIVKSGRARYIGVSNFLAYRIALALGRSAAKGLASFVSIQPRYNLLFREIEREVLPLAEEEGLGVIPYNPLAGGLLTGKHKAEAPPSSGTRFMLGTAGSRYQKRYWNETAFASVREIVGLAKEAGISPVTLSIAWVLANPVISAPLLGASRPDQLDDSLAAANYKLDDDLKRRLDAVTVEYRYGDAGR